MAAVSKPRAELNPKQREVLASVFQAGRMHCLLYGGGRSGKTFLAVYVILLRALMAPGSRHLIVRQRLKSVRRSIWNYTLPLVCEQMFPGLYASSSANKSELTFTLPNGSKIICGGLDDHGRADDLLGEEYATIYINEGSEVSFKMAQKLRTRIAQSVEITKGPNAGQPLPLRMYYDLNPAGIDHWIYQEWFLHKSPDGSTVDPSQYAVAQMNPTDNPSLPAATLAVYRGFSGAMAERFLFGRFLADVLGALWSQAVIDWGRVAEAPDTCHELCISVDPSFNTGSEKADAVGITVVGGAGDEAFLLADYSQPMPLSDWPEFLVDLYFERQADAMVIEDAFGQFETVRQLILAVPANEKRPGGAGVNMIKGTANRSKATRAEPVRALCNPTPEYPRGRFHVVGSAPQFEIEARTWIPGSKSPNALDACVHGVTWVMRRLLGFHLDAPVGAGEVPLSRPQGDLARFAGGVSGVDWTVAQGL